MNDRYLDGVVVGRRSLTDRIVELSIGATDGSALPLAEAGSHVELRFGGTGGRFLRHYSIVGPLTLLVNGVPRLAGGNRRTLFFTPDGPGFARLTVMDARGFADSVVVRIE